jgi:hypothetical protein
MSAEVSTPYEAWSYQTGALFAVRLFVIADQSKE